MKKPPAFQFYPDDFLGGVADMTQSEVGAYILLLCQQWNRGSIPVEPDRQQLLAKGSVPEHVLAKFEKCQDGSLRNHRMEEERQKQDEYRQKQREKGVKSGLARGTPAQPQFNRSSTKPEPTTQPEPQPNTNSPSPSPSPIKKEKVFGYCESHVGMDVQPDEIYQSYPIKVGKPDALRAIERQMKVFCPMCLLTKVRDYTRRRKGNERDVPSVPHPATWFNQQRFNDDASTWGPSTKQQSTTREVHANVKPGTGNY